MVCGVCKKAFIKSFDLTDYYNKKRAFEDQVSKMIDTLTDKELEQKNDDIWDELLQFEAVLLSSENKPKKCSSENCTKHICRFCYNTKNNKICTDCKND